MNTPTAALLIAFAAVSASAAKTPDFPLKSEETLHQSYPLAGNGSLVIDNVWGSIHVAAADTRTIDVTIHKTIHAASDLALSQAKRDVTVDVKKEPTAVTLLANGPFRCPDGGACPNMDEASYVVAMNFDLTVPRRTALTLQTRYDGDIRVDGVSGDFSIHNLNGSIDVEDAAGSGTASTVHGSIKIGFRENPTANSYFGSTYGPIDLYFGRSLSADFRLRSIKGGVYSDFALSALPPRETRTEQRNGKLVYRTDAFTGGRVGAGGPEITIENHDGDIHVHERPIH